ncbi:MAG: alkaline phosphatase family protein [Opitutus sp.]|nr:alkaline phosphatase family protein [Opitutus sp.]
MRIARMRANPRVGGMRMRLVALLLLLVAGLGGTSCQGPVRPRREDQILILLSIDGFRWDYLDLHEAPTLRRLARAGVHARRMTPSFPSKTFPNHYTLVTGLRPETHGIVANWFYDPATGGMFNMAKFETHWWQDGEPVWITAEKQGVRSACFFWPGSETELQGLRPSLYRAFDKKLTCAERVDGLLAWLDRPAAERPKFLTLYFDLVDTAGHTFGPEAPETRAAVREADGAVARLLSGLGQRGLAGRTNLVIVSDHGLAETSADRVVFIEDLVDIRQVRIESLGPNGGVRPLPGAPAPAELAAAIRAKAPPQVQAYLREEVPAHLHYRNHPRIPPVVLIADDRWVIESKAGWARLRATFPRGSHGWDPANGTMGALFLAHGPAFKRRHEFADVENIHVYNLLCATLGIRPAKNEGDDRLAREALRP